MKLSVVIPVFNGADFIDSSYTSIINQDIDDFEILYVDNNSDDASIQHIKKICDTDIRVRLYIQKKQGAAAARNMGIQQARGDYIYVFDVDDEIYPTALLKMISVLDDYPNVDAVFGKLVKSSKHMTDTTKPKDETFEVVLNQKPYWGLAWFSNLKIVVGPPGFLYRNHVFEAIGMYNEDIRNNEDTAFDIKLGMTSQVAFIDMYVYLYYKHRDSTIQTSKREIPRAVMIWPRLVKEHLPFYLNHDTPIRFKQLLFAQLFQSMGRQLQYTRGYLQRQQLRSQLLSDVDSIKIPFIIRFYLSILVLFPFKFVRKVYGYYIVPHVVKNIEV